MTTESRRAVKPHKKSAIPGVTIKQFVEVIPKGCSKPDFERKPITLTLQEGKNAVFRAVVKGEPPPKVIWKRSKEEMNNPDKYQMSFNGITNEFILQINKLTAEDTDLYHCSAVNEYGEAACTAGLKVIQVSFKKTTKPFPTESREDLKKELQDYRKMLRKRTPLPAQKKEVDMEQVWQLLLNADRKDYEKICLKHGIVDFRGMLRKLQQMKKDREDKQQQYIYSVTNLKHIKVNKEGNATFHLEMDLKNPESRIYLYKDGQLINYGFNDDKVKHCLRQEGKKYNFTINHLQLEDAGVYQIKVEDVDVFSTELEADFIPVGFRHLLSEVHCHEQGNAIFECSLYSPCYDAVWLYRKHPIEENDKYKISISPDGLTHQLVIKNTQLTDKGTYTLDIRICSSNAWLEVEPARGKSRQTEGDGTDKNGWQMDKSMLPDEEGAKELLQGEGLGNQNHLKSTAMVKDGQYGSNQDGSGELYGSSVDVDWRHGSLGQDGLTGRVGKDGRMGKSQFSEAGTDGVSLANGNKFGLASNEGGRVGKIHGQDLELGGAGMGGAIDEWDLHSFYGEVSMLGGAGSGGGLEGAGGLGSLGGRDSMLGGAGARLGSSGELGSLHSMEGGADTGGAGLGGAGSIRFLYGKDGTLGGPGGSGASLGATGDAGSLYGKDIMLCGASVGIGLDGAGNMGALGDRDAILGASDVGGAGLGDAGGTSSLFGKDGMLGGDGGSGAGLGGARVMGSLYGKDGMLGGDGGSGAGLGGARVMDSLYGKNGMLGGAGGSGAGLGGAGGMDSLYGKDGMLGGAGGSGAGLGGAGGMVSLYGKDGMLGGAGGSGAGLGGTGGMDSLYGKDGMLGGAGGSGTGLGGTGGMGSLYGKDGMLGGAGVGIGLDGAEAMGAPGGRSAMLGAFDVGGAGSGGAGSMGSLCSKDGMKGGTSAGSTSAGGIRSLYDKDDMLAGAGAHDAGLDDACGVKSLYGKDGMRGAIGAVAGGDEAETGGASPGFGGTGGFRSSYGKDDMLGGDGAGTGVGGDDLGSPGAMGSLYDIDGTVGGAGAAGAGSGFGSARDMVSLYGENGMIGGAGSRAVGSGAGVSSPGRMGTLSGKDATPGGADAGLGGAGSLTGSLYGKNHMYSAGLDDSRGEDYLCGKDGMLDGAGTGLDNAGRMGSLYGKDPILGGHGVGHAGAGLAGTGSMGSLSGKDAMLDRAGSGCGLDGAGVRYAMLEGAGTGSAGIGAGLGGAGSCYGKDGMLGGAGAGVAGGMGVLDGKDSMLSVAAGAGGIGSLCGKDGKVSGAGPGAGLSGAEGMESFYDKDGMFGGTSPGAGVGGAGVLDSIHSKGLVLGGAGPGTGGEFTGAWGTGSLDSRDSILDGAIASGGNSGLGHLGSLYGRDPALGGAVVGAGGKLQDGSNDGRMPGVHGEGSLGYDQMSGHHGGVQADARRGQMPGLNARGLSAEETLKNRDWKRRGGFLQDEARESHCHFDKGLSDVSAQKGKPAVLSCSLNNDQVEETSFKDEFKQLTGLDEVSSEKYGLVHKLIDTVEDSHAGKDKFEAESVKTEASILVEDPPNVDKALLEKLMKEPVIVKAGQNAMVKIPFKGRKPVRATWLKDGDELLNDARIHIDKADNFTRLLISSTDRKDCGDYKVKLKNENGTLEASLKLEVIDKPQKPVGPIEVVDSSTTGITIRWKPPEDDGGTPVQNYIIEKQQVGRKTWVTLGETSRNNSTFTTNKVRQDKSYRFRVRAVNAEGKSKALESDEVMAATKAFPGPPAPPQIVSVNKESITLSWKAPPKTGNSRILGYIVEKRKKGSNIWTPITDLPITDRKWMVTDLKEGLQYEFRVAAVSATGVGETSAPSDAVFARDPMKPPGRVRDLKVTNTDYTSITLAWMKPDSKEGGSAKGYKVEKRSSDSLKWTHCNTVPIGLTTCTVKGLQAREMYFLRVRAVNEGGLGEALALDTCIQAVPPIVNPKFLRDDTMKNLMIIKVGNCIRVHMPFEASPTPEAIWLKDGLPLPSRAIVSTRDGLSQLLIPSAEFSDSGLYTIILQNEWGKKESFSFQVQVTDIPQSPGPILLQEKILNTVTVIWEPSPTEKWESNLYYVVMKCDSNKGSWQVVGDLIYTNKFTITKLIPGRGYYFRVVAKNYMGTSDPSETVQPWIMQKEKDEFKVRLPKYRRVNQNMPPRFLVQLKPHVVTTAFDCHMSCAVGGYPKPKITWYKDGRNLSEDPTFFSTNDFGVCCLVIPGVTKRDEGEYKLEATNELGHAVSKAMLIIKDPSF